MARVFTNVSLAVCPPPSITFCLPLLARLAPVPSQFCVNTFKSRRFSEKRQRRQVVGYAAVLLETTAAYYRHGGIDALNRVHLVNYTGGSKGGWRVGHAPSPRGQAPRMH